MPISMTERKAAVRCLPGSEHASSTAAPNGSAAEKAA
jgi:hypothetical protein